MDTNDSLHRSTGVELPFYCGSMARKRMELRRWEDNPELCKQLRQLRWTLRHLRTKPKNDPRKLPIARRLRTDTTMTWAWITARLHAGSLAIPGQLLAKCKTLSIQNVGLTQDPFPGPLSLPCLPTRSYPNKAKRLRVEPRRCRPSVQLAHKFHFLRDRLNVDGMP